MQSYLLKDLKTYSVDYAIASQANALNVDFRFYCYGSTGEPRLYSCTLQEPLIKKNEYVGTTVFDGYAKKKEYYRFLEITIDFRL